MIKLLAISGSLRSRSSNTALLKALEKLVSDNINFSVYPGLGTLPHFNPDLDEDISTVQAWRSQLQEADGVIFCTPEYAHGVPGVLKNALDWIVSSGEFMNKPTAVISASPSPDGGKRANASLVQTLSVMMALIEEETSLCISGVSAKINREAEILDSTLENALSRLIESLLSAITVQ